jgi:hypothetical protein
MNCRLDAGETVPDKAAKICDGCGWGSDFFLTPGFAGELITFDVHGVLTPSGVVNLTATYPAP